MEPQLLTNLIMSLAVGALMLTAGFGKRRLTWRRTTCPRCGATTLACRCHRR